MKWFEKHKRGLTLAVILVLMAAIGVFFTASLLRSTDETYNLKAMALLWLGVDALAMLGLTAVWFLIARDKLSLEKAAVLLLAVLCLAYTAVFPPRSVPDENTHYYSAYRLSNYFLLKFDQAKTDALLIRESDLAFMEQQNTPDVHRASYYNVKNNFRLFDSSPTTAFDAPDAFANAPAGYVVSGIALALGRLVHLGSAPLFYFGRLTNAALFIFLTVWAMKKTPYGKMMLLTVAALPMTMHEAASFSYDCTALGLTFLFIATLLRLKECPGKAKIGEFILLTVTGMLLAPTKLVYTPLLFLIFLLPARVFGLTKKKAFFAKAGMVLAGVLALVLVQMGNLADTTQASHTLDYADGAPGYTLGWLLANPKTGAYVFLNTFLEQGSYFIETMFGSYFGWFQIHVPLWTVLPFEFLFLLSCFRRSNEPEQDLLFGEKLWTALLLAGSVFLTLLSMFLFWTPLNNPIILGVQGRYFLPLLPLVMLLVRGKKITVDASFDRWLAALLYVCQYVILNAAFALAFV